jgi:hypothetical protein
MPTLPAAGLLNEAALRRWGIELRFTDLIVLRLGSNILPRHETLQSLVPLSPSHSTRPMVPLLPGTTSHRATPSSASTSRRNQKTRDSRKKRFATENTRITKRLEELVPVKTPPKNSVPTDEHSAQPVCPFCSSWGIDAVVSPRRSMSCIRKAQEVRRTPRR